MPQASLWHLRMRPASIRWRGTEARAPIIPLNHTRIDICHRYIAIHLTYDVTVPSSSHNDSSGNYVCTERWNDVFYLQSKHVKSFRLTCRMFFFKYVILVLSVNLSEINVSLRIIFLYSKLNFGVSRK